MTHLRSTFIINIVAESFIYTGAVVVVMVLQIGFTNTYAMSAHHH